MLARGIRSYHRPTRIDAERVEAEAHQVDRVRHVVPAEARTTLVELLRSAGIYGAKSGCGSGSP